MCLLSPCHGQSSLARAAAPVAEESSGSNCPEPPWECRVGKGLISHVENLSLGLLTCWLLVLLLLGVCGLL